MDINLQIENALKNTDITNIMNKASKTFTKQLDEDIIYSCQLKALWKCLLNFDRSRDTKFTTYLFNGVKFECLKELKIHKKHNASNRKKLHNNISCHTSNDILLIDLIDETSNEEEKNILIDKISGMSNQTIAQKYGVTRETLRKRFKKITSSFEYKFI